MRLHSWNQPGKRTRRAGWAALSALPFAAILAWAAIPGPGCSTNTSYVRALLIAEDAALTDLVNVATGETIAIDLSAGDCVELDVADGQYRDADVGQWRQLSDLALCWQDGEPPVRDVNCSPPPITGDGECTDDIVHATRL